MPRKAQSAMEYLMTYGWAILIIGIVLATLFSLGVFSGGSLLGTACVASPGFLCTNPVMLGPPQTNNGAITFTFGQNTGATIYDVQFACTATSISSGPNPSTAYMDLYGTGSYSVAANSLGLTSNSLVSGQEITIGPNNALPCYGSTGASLYQTSPAIGTSFAGTLWMQYTQAAGGESATNPWLEQKVAIITLKVS
jgi:hypothetical protein